MITVRNIYDFLNTLCPYELAEEWDNVGLNLGDGAREVRRILITLDLDLETIALAESQGCELILTHHPLMFSAPAQITADAPIGRRILRLAASGIAHIACHTNWDAAEGGVNCILADLCGLQNQRAFGGLARIGDTDTNLSALAARLKAALPAETCLAVKSHEAVKRVAVVGGSGGSMLEAAIAEGCDTFVTGEAKHDHALLAREQGINLLMLGHYETEYASLSALQAAVSAAFPEAEVLLAPRKAVLEQL